jgi:hypothetical protein
VELRTAIASGSGGKLKETLYEILRASRNFQRVTKNGVLEIVEGSVPSEEKKRQH